MDPAKPAATAVPATFDVTVVPDFFAKPKPKLNESAILAASSERTADGRAASW
jgi:hypothetical protein